MTTEQFHWTSLNGVEIVLPHVKQIKSGLLRKYRKLNEVDMMFSILEEVIDEDMLERLDDLEQGELDDLFGKWQKASVAVGKSSGSST